ncbi:hypothetical protein [Aquisphaera insulae]|uniref:hypothetical protein n=1 Tax=Aquisphaera insulae TaxID=2712864 RepID=UPI0013EDC7CB|nr:hypothetical protein [Aquisphaera insulae]
MIVPMADRTIGPRLVVATLVALALARLAPAEVKAGCAHGMAARALGADDLGFLEGIGALVDEGSPSADASPVRREDGRGGCTGPSCSGRSGLPAIPAAVVSPRSARWAALDVPPPPPATASSARLLDGIDAWANPPIDAVYHPPRRPASPSAS